MSETLTEFCRLERRRYDLKAKLAEADRQSDALRDEALHDLELRNARQLPAFERYGMRLRLVAKTKVEAINDTDDVVAALRKSRKTEFIGVNWPALISYAKRATRIPHALQDALRIRSVNTIDVERKKRGAA